MNIKKRIKKYSLNSLLLLVSLIICLLLGEFIVRLFHDPVDFLHPNIIQDPILGHRIDPENPGGHDKWGFRNKSVPDQASIVTIGDSLTYGLNATSRDSWPNQLQEISKREVYNLGIQGYGPLQYLHILKTKALLLKPKYIFLGLYYGNDYIDSYNLANGLSHWKHLKSPTGENISQQKNKAILKENPKPFLYPVRKYLHYNSVLYKLMAFTVLEKVKYLLCKYVEKSDYFYLYENKKYNINLAFETRKHPIGLYLDNPKVKEGMQITFDILNEMQTICQKNNIKFVIVIIPTKERVYKKLILEDKKLSKIFQKHLSEETKVDMLTQSFLKENKIPYINSIPYLEKASYKKQLYPNNYEDHPKRNGYRVIAEAINEYLDKPE
jgi:lysophospholipase L1-like esterase